MLTELAAGWRHDQMVIFVEIESEVSNMSSYVTAITIITDLRVRTFVLTMGLKQMIDQKLRE